MSTDIGQVDCLVLDESEPIAYVCTFYSGDAFGVLCQVTIGNRYVALDADSIDSLVEKLLTAKVRMVQGGKIGGEAMLWLIYNPTDETFWSNKHGWTGLDEADIFNDEERDIFHLPIDGEWRHYKQFGL